MICAGRECELGLVGVMGRKYHLRVFFATEIVLNDANVGLADV